MTARRLTALVILIAFLAFAVLSFLGDRVLSVIFIVVAGAVLGRHAVSLCARCSNIACAFNPRASAAAGGPPELREESASGFSDLPITWTTVVPLLATGPLAVIAAWKYSPVATVVVVAVALTAHSVFRRLTCSHCGNDCAGNCNRSYREWKRTQSGAVD
jgi:lysylphosphatidylglycerol synthetase-like protein (DUF2156 family)